MIPGVGNEGTNNPRIANNDFRSGVILNSGRAIIIVSRES